MREKSFASFLQAYEVATQSAGAFVVVTLVNIKGSAPQDVGARMIVGRDGLIWGTVGGGKVEAHAITEAQNLLNKKNLSCQLCEWNLQTDIGMTCGGVAQLFFEKHDPGARWQVAVFGAGHVGQALVRTLLPLDIEVLCVDSRKEWLDKLPSAPNLKIKQADDMVAIVETLSVQAFVVIMTMGHQTDLPILTATLKRGFPYVGNMGSEQKAKVLRSDLLKAGLSPDQVNSFFCPIGERLGNNSPAEIAISITAQLLRERDRVCSTGAAVKA